MSSQDDDGDWETDSEASPESDDIEPLDWDIFFDTKPAEWFRDSKGYTQYKDQDKGHIAEHPEHRFQTAEAGVVLSSICKEIKRLQNHRELFPTEYVGEQFLGNVYDICGWVEEAFGFFQEELNMWHKLFDLELAEIKAASWPTFRAGRNPWHQFLHNGAPGHRVIPKQAPKTESMQIIPPGGLNLLQAWQTEIEDILKTYDEVSKLRFESSALNEIK
ncbi:hypothetical protein MMC26_007474 [Xylographa opegraphella]|nr:hypothetical protein [Xylographa opegraphella]